MQKQGLVAQQKFFQSKTSYRVHTGRVPSIGTLGKYEQLIPFKPQTQVQEFVPHQLMYPITPWWPWQ